MILSSIPSQKVKLNKLQVKFILALTDANFNTSNKGLCKMLGVKNINEQIKHETKKAKKKLYLNVP